MNNHKIGMLAVFMVILLGPLACREFYEPEVTDIDHQFLVVEGFLEIGGGISEINLTQTMPIYLNQTSRPVSQANVQVESEHSGTWIMNRSQAGKYTLEATLPESDVYRVRIQTSFGEYLSDEIIPVPTSEDLELGYVGRPGYVSIHASTTGTDQSKYFIWEFEEDWEFRSPYQNYYYFDEPSRTIRNTPFNEIVQSCYQSFQSSNIILESSERFQNQRITRKEIQRIDTLSEKLGERYSILVRQRGLDRDAFEFWDAMRKNSDEIGGIFSPMPSMIGTNIRSLSNPGEPVIGYVSAGKTVEKRMYIDKRELDGWASRIEDYRFCVLDTVTPLDYEDRYIIGDMVPVLPICEGAVCVTYMASTRNCTDCRLRGSEFPPDFWEPYDHHTP
ncbi:MAG: DUF4249 domain-containing protein [Lunatimonas sp.]|uniref:DUF4249 domain-containing protein n=1 Tax=Lunatimonas sp. TaxID=2060141 RepID=UPI00263B5F51|nr:DUF4249 domain-containing protein [Lunatimonas sp.]MCC5938187.1 DUF4249 domain-containing protein [Lunatimonas sp.]